MTTNLPATFDGMDNRALMRAIGQDNSPGGIDLPKLSVNYEDADDDGNDIPRGKWMLSKNGVTVFADTVDVRIMYSTFQYSHYDKEAKKLHSLSVHFHNFNEEIPDTGGTFKCGKVSKKKFEQLTPAEQALQKQIKAARILFCLATIEGKDAKGKKASFKDEPCMLFARGASFMPITDYMNDLRDKNLPSPLVVTRLALERKKNDGVTYWEMVPSNQGVITLTKDDYVMVQKFADTVNADNEQIVSQWQKARAKGMNGTQVRAAAMLTGPNDEIPDLSGYSGDLSKDLE